MVWVLGWRPNHPYLCTPWDRKSVFESLQLVSLNCIRPEKSCAFWGGAPTTQTTARYGPERCFLISKMVVFETHHSKKYGLGSGVAPQTRIPLHTMGSKRYFWMPKKVVFETHHAKKHGVGFGVAPRTPLPLHTMGQKICFLGA